MVRAVGLFLSLVACSDSTTQTFRRLGDRDLGDHLQPIDGEDLGSPRDLSGADFAGPAARDLAGTGVPDLAGMPDLSHSSTGEPPIYVHTASALYTLDPDTYDITLIGSFGIADDITDLAEKDDGSLVAVSRTQLYTVDKNSGAASLVGDTLVTDMNALSYLSDGRLLGADIPGNVYEISFNTGGIFNVITVNTIGSYGSGQSTAGDLISVDDGTTWGLANGGGVATDSNNVLMIVNNVNGTGTPIGPTGFGKLWGAAYSRSRILAVSSTGQVVEINPATGAGTLKRTHAGISFYGATSNPNVLP